VVLVGQKNWNKFSSVKKNETRITFRSLLKKRIYQRFKTGSDQIKPFRFVREGWRELERESGRADEVEQRGAHVQRWVEEDVEAWALHGGLAAT
jgi:hypothetical protein